MKLSKLTNPKAQNQSRYLKKKKKNYYFFFKNKSFEMKLLKITDPKAQNQSQYLKKGCFTKLCSTVGKLSIVRCLYVRFKKLHQTVRTY
jgi:hypothetical protein